MLKITVTDHYGTQFDVDVPMMTADTVASGKLFLWSTGSDVATYSLSDVSSFLVEVESDD